MITYQAITTRLGAYLIASSFLFSFLSLSSFLPFSFARIRFTAFLLVDLCCRVVLRVGCHGEDKELARGGEFGQWNGRSRGNGQFSPFISFFFIRRYMVLEVASFRCGFKHDRILSSVKLPVLSNWWIFQCLSPYALISIDVSLVAYHSHIYFITENLQWWRSWVLFS